MLMAGFNHQQHNFLRLPNDFNADNFFSKLAGRAFFRQQRAEGSRQVAGRQGLLKLSTFG